MLFNSFQFLIFFPVVTLGYFLLPHRARWLWLLTASCYFYMAFIPVYLLILAFTIVVDYVAGLLIERSSGARRRAMLVASLVANVGVLAFFKYYGFAAGNLNALAEAIGWNYSVPALGIILPIGLSFHTFQSMSYTIEVYRGNVPAEKHFGIFALYVMFYPQLVAGPIERPQNLLPQFHRPHVFDYDAATSGLRLMAWGFFKKMVVADGLGFYVSAIYGSPRQYAGFPLIVATVFFAFQIYGDFSGYSDIARGSARVMGIDLMKNFDRPYSASSVSEFWTRWHISLSSWFKDYVYIPLGGNRGGQGKQVRNLMITFVLSGLWHGANWTYVFWGFLNGVYLSASVLTRSVRERLRAPEWAQVLFTFALVCFGWIFFRAATFAEAWYILTHLFANAGDWASQLADKDYLKAHLYLGESGRRFRTAALSIPLLVAIETLHSRRPIHLALLRQPPALRWAAYVAIVLFILNSGVVSELPFIYFQF